MPKVWITQDNKKNYTPAHRYGEPEFITNLEYSSIQNSTDNKEIHYHIKKAVSTYDPSNDYVLLSGDPIVISLVIHNMLNEYGVITVLKWSGQDKMYIPISLSDQGVDINK